MGRKYKCSIDLKELLDRALCYVPSKISILRVFAGIYDPIGLIQLLGAKFKIVSRDMFSKCWLE